MEDALPMLYLAHTHLPLFLSFRLSIYQIKLFL